MKKQQKIITLEYLLNQVKKQEEKELKASCQQKIVSKEKVEKLLRD